MVDITEQNPAPDEEKREFPQHLCKMCGRCCKSITTALPLDELEILAEKGSADAKTFLEIFKPYKNIEEAQKVVPEQVTQVLKELESTENFDINKLIFYYCPHINENNLCTIHENRPECCRRAPHHGWSCMPPGCGFEGWQFEHRERIKKKIRKLKEYLITIEAIAENGSVPGQNMTVEEVRKSIEQKISPWKKYGAEYW